MGAVYKARDTRLDRVVAIKVGAAAFSERFEREARAVAALNHPNICTLHDVGPNYLVMEFIDGKPLAGPMPVEEVIRLGTQIASALDAAHRRGITHRDLKPANILVTKAGVKLLDFGLAKMARTDGSSDLTASIALTQENTILGTLQYMSPEQLEGREADARSDIFAFGLVLYEMVSGKRAFAASSQASLIGAILHSAPKPLEHAGLERIVRRCLDKDPDRRWQNARDLMMELEEAGAGPAVVAPAKARGFRYEWVAIPVLLAVIAAMAFAWPRGKAVELPKLKVQIGDSSIAVISPDGRQVVMETPDELVVQSLDTLASHALKGKGIFIGAFWSPDSKQVGFFDVSTRMLKGIDVASGAIVNLCEASQAPRGGSWNENGTILFASNSGKGIWRVAENGGTPVAVTAPEKDSSDTYPSFLPDGKHFLFVRRNLSTRSSAIFAGSLDSKDVHRIVDSTGNGLYASPGYLLHMRGTTLLMQKFDVERLEVHGEATPIAEDIRASVNSQAGNFSVSRNGLLTYSQGGFGRNQLVIYGRDGKLQRVVDDTNYSSDPSISPEGKRVAVTRMNSKTAEMDAWVLDLERGSAARITTTRGASQPAWTPDGKRFAVVSRGRFREVSLADGKETEFGEGDGSGTYSPDGKTFLYPERRFFDAHHKMFLRHLAEGTTEVFLESAGSLDQPKFSPDGRWVAYVSGESGRTEVVVQSVAAGKEKYQVSTEGGAQPVWRRDGRELFYQSNKRELMAVPVRVGAGFEAGKPQVLFPIRSFGILSARSHFDVSADGQRFVVMEQLEKAPAQPVILMQNWLPGAK